MRAIARPLTWVLLAFIGVISLWTPLAHPQIAQRWFTFPNLLLVRAGAAAGRRSASWQLAGAAEGRAARGAVRADAVLVFLGYSGLGISLWPHIIPPAVSIWDAAAPPQSLGFALVGALLIIPMILMYTAWSYWVFRGKVQPGEGYH